MTDLPQAPDGCEDLRVLPRVLIDPCVLRGPAFAGLSDAGFRAQVMLWAAAWHEVPAGSLPDCAASLCAAAGLGRDMGAWAQVSGEVLAHWVLCDDGRLWLMAMREAVEFAASRLTTARRQDSERQRALRIRRLMREAGVPFSVSDDRIGQSAARIAERLEEAGGARLKGPERREAARAIAAELGWLAAPLLPFPGGGDVSRDVSRDTCGRERDTSGRERDMSREGFRPIGAALGAVVSREKGRK